MTVRRTLPQRHRSLIGAWCFVDHYGPDEVAASGGMSVAPHPHTGLQTVSWLFAGEIEHRDSAGNHAMVRPGEVNLMTAGRGIGHSEVSTAGTDVLHGAQLWVALPDADRDTEPGFQHHAPTPVRGPGWEARVFLGSLLGETSPVATHTPLLGAEIMLDARRHARARRGRRLRARRPGRHRVVGIAAPRTGRHRDQARRAGVRRARPRPPRADGVRRGAGAAARWRAVGRVDRDVVELRRPHPRGDRRVPRGVAGPDRRRRTVRASRPGRFGIVIGEHLPPIPAPALPNARLKERR